MKRIGDIYKANAAAGTLMLSNFTVSEGNDFWEEYRTNHTRYDRVFNRMFNSFYPFMQQDDDTLSDIVDAFRDDVYDHLLMNQKKYEELYRVQVIPDDDYSLINNYDMQEIMDKDISDDNDNTYGSRSDSSTINIGEQTNTSTGKVAPYDSTEYANNTQLTDVTGTRQDGTSNTKGQQIDELNRTYTEDYTLHRVGNIGVQTVSDMLSKHIKVWSIWEFYEYIFKEISKDLLLL